MTTAKQTNRFSQHRHTMSIHGVIREKTDLAKIYAEDGAFHTAARVLEDLATVVSRHAVATSPRDLDDPINLAGSGPVPIEAREG
ncbi:MAG: hypothetical protein E5V63_08200 [Mesorhizobium sp.]|nr:MAG: hypothetical protein E5V63_08200 [Mesorhizobium sp.]